MTLEDIPEQSLARYLSVYRNDGKPIGPDEALRLEEQGMFTAPMGRSGGTNFGLTNDEVWLSLEFRAGTGMSGRRILEIAHASLDHVELFVHDGDRWLHTLSGDHLPFTARLLPHRHHLFELLLEPGQDYRLFLRVASSGTLTVPVVLWQPDALWHNDQQSYALFSLYYGLLIGLLIYNLFLFISLRDRLYLIYVAFVGLLGLGQAGLIGLSHQFVWPDDPFWANLSPTGGVAAAGVFGALFVQRFLAGTPATLRLQWLMPAISVVFGLIFLCALLGSYHVAAIAVNVTALLFAFSSLVMGAVSLYHREPGARFFVIAWVSLFAGMIVMALHNLGALPSNPLTSNALLIGSAAEMLMLSLALADRINGIQLSHQRALAAAVETRQQMVEALRESERQLESRVNERTLALAQANEQLRESKRQLEQQANHDALTGLANRKLLNERLAWAQAQSRRHGTRFGVLMADMDKFKAINDSLGHKAGDEVLVEVARRLRSAVRETDTVARIGGDEFFLVIESVSQRNDLESVRAKLIDDIARPILLTSGHTVTVGISIGAAIYPEDASSVELLFSLADNAMYKSKVSLEKDPTWQEE
ncbi:diguanylate cyclase domain-containing protein [Pseudomonas sp.]|uniref:diguanylate cyclase domain-containing protein n=1 Tax=Pseudomonas sp. TaxID=306 RepID=UPI00272A4771|nr:diguanylate cyclase [Pseudomonas sp.]